MNGRKSPTAADTVKISTVEMREALRYKGHHLSNPDGVSEFATIFFLTGAIKAAFGFMIVSKIYTTIAYFIDERNWTKIGWGFVES